MIALLLVCSLPVSVLADTWYLEDGSITVNATKSSQTVTQGSTSKDDDAPVITQHDSETATTNTITINAAENATAQVTLDDVNINNSRSFDIAAVQTTGAGDVTIELDGENTVQGGYYYAGVDKDNTGALVITNTDEVTEEDPGSLTATGGRFGAGIGGGHGRPDASNITITGNAVVTATGGQYGAGIGGGHATTSNPGDGENITIEQNAHVTASSQGFGAGIGGGTWADGSNITISDNAYVEAVSGRAGAGIGGGCNADGSNITISDNAQVKAQGGEKYSNGGGYGAGAAIGDGGKKSNVNGVETIVDTSGLEEGWIARYANDPETRPYYVVPDLSLEDKEVTSVIYRDENGQLHTATENIVEIDAADPTCTEAGHKAGFQIGDKIVAVTTDEATGHNMGAPYTTKEPTCTEEGVAQSDCADCDYYETSPIEKLKHTMGEPYTYKEPTCQEEGVARRDCANCDYYETEPIGIVDHSYGDYTSDGNATCTADGTKTRNCIWCDLPDTVPDPGSALGHSFTNYVSDGNATYTEDGTKTAQCDHEGCVETDTVTDAGSRLPYYLVKGQDGRILPSQEERQDGVLTITVEADFASLTGTLGGMRALKGQGIDTIVFVTNGASSTFAMEDLLAQGSAGSTYMLTHDGEAVTFTLGDSTDIGEILK